MVEVQGNLVTPWHGPDEPGMPRKQKKKAEHEKRRRILPVPTARRQTWARGKTWHAVAEYVCFTRTLESNRIEDGVFLALFSHSFVNDADLNKTTLMLPRQGVG